MVEEAIVLVEHIEEDCLAPDFGVGSQRVEHTRNVPRAKVRWPVAVLRVRFGSNNPRHLRQAIGQNVFSEDVERAVLHHDDDVLDVMDGAGLVIGRNRQSAGNACRKSGGCRSGGQEFRKSRPCVLMLNSDPWITLVAIAGGSLVAARCDGVMF